mgnify:FL=1
MALPAVDGGWWLLAVLCYGVGDYATTVLAVRRYAVVEANPVVSRLLSRQPGPIGFALLKGTMLAVTFGGYLLIADSPIAVGIPIAVAAIGLVVTVSNLLAIRRSRRLNGSSG